MHHVEPIAPQLNVPAQLSLTELQQLCGNINWVKSALPISTAQLNPLFELLQTSSNPPEAITKKITITPEARKAIQAVSRALQSCALQCYDPTQPILALILATPGTPTGVLWQQGPLLWLHPSKSKLQKICPAIRLWISLATDLNTLCLHTYHVPPSTIVWPLNAKQTTHLIQTNEDMQVLLEDFRGEFDNHLPHHKLLQGLVQLPFADPFHPFPLQHHCPILPPFSQTPPKPNMRL